MLERYEDPLVKKAAAAFQQAAAKVVRLARQTGTPIITQVNGEVRSVSADDLPGFDHKPIEGNPIQAPS